jgi:IclR family acetate operon transcriptional repressor
MRGVKHYPERGGTAQMSTVTKALGLLEYFSKSRPEIGLSNFTQLTNFDKGTVFRYLTALRDQGFLDQNPLTKAYRLGPAFIRLAAVREITVPLVSLVAPIVDRLAEDTHELVHAALPQMKGMSTLHYLDGGHGGIRVGFNGAGLLPFHATSSGIAMLAFGHPDLFKNVISGEFEKFTDQTSVQANDLTQRIEYVRSSGFAAANQWFEADVCSVALPFFDGKGIALGTISIATPASRMSDDARTSLVHTLVHACTALTSTLGGQVPAYVSSMWAHL